MTAEHFDVRPCALRTRSLHSRGSVRMLKSAGGGRSRARRGPGKPELEQVGLGATRGPSPAQSGTASREGALAAQVAGDITDHTVVGDFQSLRNGPLEGRSDAEASSGPASRLQPDHPPTSRTHQYDLLHLGATDLIACVGPCLLIISYTITLPGVEAIGRGFAKLTQREKKACSMSIVATICYATVT